jgi:Zn-dependent peptidase ImmA (M78 family)
MIGDRLRRTRLAAGLTLDELRLSLQEAGVTLTRAALSKYELNKSTPPAATLMKLARVLNVPPSHFLQEPKTAITWLAFRKHPRLPAGRQEHIKAYALQVAEQQMWLEEALNVATPAAFPPPRLVTMAEEAEQAALDLRDTWKLGEAPIESVTQTAETHGAVVIAWSHDEGTLDGLSAWVNGATPLAVVNDKVSPDRRRFTLAHEFGHMLMMPGGDQTGIAEEQFAHRFAAAFLVPGPVAIQELGRRRRRLSLREIALLKQKYGLSMLGWIHRAHDLEIIDHGLYHSLYRTFVANGWKKVEPEAYHGDEAPIRLEQLTARALAEGILTEARARQICPRAVTTLLQSEPRISAHGPRAVQALPRGERNRVLTAAASLAAPLYREGGELTGFDAFGEENFLDDAEEG